MTQITIPPEALEAGVRAAIARDSGPEGSKLFEIHWAEFADSYRDSLRAAFTAMVSAWPMSSPYDHYVTPDGKPCASIILPLQESSDDRE